MTRTVLLVDDEKQPLKYYVWALEREGFKVMQCYDPDTAFDFVDKQTPDIVAVILDIMMLPGERYRDKDTQEGLTTGTFLYDDLRSRYPDVPVIVITNVSNRETLQYFKGDPKLQVVQKLDVPPFELAQLVSRMVESDTE